ncbi:ly6/PLAUR domain-containing protein 6B isoform X2 [Scyliorhinus torazame]|uniref:ly6/PLAUR domain-containing protein 6B isoform X2 n=1 Tax=Scyliorhinus torazame TaxID=75743 RepID=UPI003B5A3C1B
MILPDTMPITHHLARVVLFQLLIYLVDRGFTRNVNFHNVRPPMSHTEYCLTVHRFTSHGRSESVSKRCVSKEECQSVGCRHISNFGYTECTSCCEGMICNIEVPTNHTNAVLVVKQLHMFSSSANRRMLIIPWITVVLLVILLVL